MCSVSTFGSACLTLPCSLLRVRQIQSPWQPQQVTQAWSGLRNCPLTFSKRKKSHQLLVIAKTLSTDFTFTTEHFTVMIARHSKILSCLSKIQRPILSKGLSTSRSPHQVSTGLLEWRMCVLNEVALHSSKDIIPEPHGPHQTEVRCQAWWIILTFAVQGGKRDTWRRSYISPLCASLLGRDDGSCKSCSNRCTGHWYETKHLTWCR